MAAKSVEERVALIEGKIAKKKEEIEALEAQKQKLHSTTCFLAMSRHGKAHPDRVGLGNQTSRHEVCTATNLQSGWLV